MDSVCCRLSRLDQRLRRFVIAAERASWVWIERVRLGVLSSMTVWQSIFAERASILLNEESS